MSAAVQISDVHTPTPPCISGVFRDGQSTNAVVQQPPSLQFMVAIRVTDLRGADARILN